MTLDNTTLSVIFVIALGGRELIILAIRRWWKKSVETEHVTKSECAECRKNCAASRNNKDSDVINMLSAMRDDLKGAEREIQALRLTIVKNMLHGNAPPEAIENVLAGNLGAGGTI